MATVGQSNFFNAHDAPTAEAAVAVRVAGPRAAARRLDVVSLLMAASLPVDTTQIPGSSVRYNE
jgi:hypothetical protein